MHRRWRFCNVDRHQGVILRWETEYNAGVVILRYSGKVKKRKNKEKRKSHKFETRHKKVKYFTRCE